MRIISVTEKQADALCTIFNHVQGENMEDMLMEIIGRYKKNACINDAEELEEVIDNNDLHELTVVLWEQLRMKKESEFTNKELELLSWLFDYMDESDILEVFNKSKKAMQDTEDEEYLKTLELFIDENKEEFDELSWSIWHKVKDVVKSKVNE